MSREIPSSPSDKSIQSLLQRAPEHIGNLPQHFKMLTAAILLGITQILSASNNRAPLPSTVLPHSLGRENKSTAPERDVEKSDVVQALIFEMLSPHPTADAHQSPDFVRAVDFSRDLRFTEAELRVIYDEMKVLYATYVTGNGLTDFQAWKRRIGLPGQESPPSQTHEKITLSGRTLELVLPGGLEEQVRRNYVQALRQMETRADLAHGKLSPVKVIPLDSRRLEFQTHREGKTLTYLATPHNVFRVDRESLLADTEAWTRMTLLRKKLERQLRITLGKDAKATAEVRYVVTAVLRDEKETAAIPPDHMVTLPEKYAVLLAQLRLVRQQETQLATAASVRMLFDETQGLAVREMVDPRFRSRLSYEYLAPDGQIREQITYSGHGKSYVLGTCDREVVFYQHDGTIAHTDHFRADNSLAARRTGHTEDFYDYDGTSLMYRRLWTADAPQAVDVMVGQQGEHLATLDVMQKNNPAMSDNDYLDSLAKNLDSPQKLQTFFALFARYVSDDPKKAGRDYSDPVEGNSDHWQSSQEMIHRLKGGKMLGDCEDYAFLAREILRRQGKTSYVIMIPGHALCVWFERGTDGRWNTFSLCTFGIDTNGNLPGNATDPEKAKGYASLEEGLNALMAKYHTIGPGVEHSIHYRMQNGQVKIMDIPHAGKKAWLDNFPIDLLPQPQVVKELFTVQRLAAAGDFTMALTKYESYLAADAAHADWYHRTIADTLGDMLESADAVKAEQVLLSYIHKYPDRPEYQTSLGIFYHDELEDDGKAEARLRFAIQQGSRDAAAFVHLAAIRKVQGDTKQPLELLETAVRLCPDMTYIQYGELAEAYEDTGNRELAIQTWEEIICRNPRESYPRIKLAQLVQQTDPQRAIALYERYIGENPDNPEYPRELAQFYGEIYRRTIAERPAVYEAALGRSKDFWSSSHVVLFQRFPLLKKLHNAQVRQLELALQNGDDEEDTYLNLIRLYRRQNNKSAMLRLCRETSAKYPRSPMVQTSINQIYEQENKAEKSSAKDTK